MYFISFNVALHSTIATFMICCDLQQLCSLKSRVLCYVWGDILYLCRMLQLLCSGLLILNLAVTKKFLFFITDPPEFVGPEIDTSVLEGGNTTLVCATSVNGNPTPTISWMDNNGRTVSDGTGISGSTTLSLTVSSVTRYQAGNWTCTAENSPGGTPRTAEHQIILTVVGECICVCKQT